MHAAHAQTQHTSRCRAIFSMASTVGSPPPPPPPAGAGAGAGGASTPRRSFLGVVVGTRPLASGHIAADSNLCCHVRRSRV